MGKIRSASICSRAIKAPVHSLGSLQYAIDHGEVFAADAAGRVCSGPCWQSIGISIYPCFIRDIERHSVGFPGIHLGTLAQSKRPDGFREQIPHWPDPIFAAYAGQGRWHEEQVDLGVVIVVIFVALPGLMRRRWPCVMRGNSAAPGLAAVLFSRGANTTGGASRALV
jgi:hypothetical protein